METEILKTFDSYFSAHIVLGRLQSEGIACRLKDEHTVTIDPLLNNAVGGIKLEVVKDQAEQAMALLAQYEIEYVQQAECPRCKQKEMERLIKPGEMDWTHKLLAYFIKSYHVEPVIVYRCKRCHYESNTLPDKYAYYNTA